MLTKIIRAHVIFFFVIYCAACTSTNLDQKSETQRVETSFPVDLDHVSKPFAYGRFCGPGFPKIYSENPQIQIKHLFTLVPFDDIDAACRRHDLCYAQNGFNNLTCNNDLILELFVLMGAMNATTCNRVVADILYWFLMVQPGFELESPFRSTVVAAFTVVAGSIYHLPYLYLRKVLADNPVTHGQDSGKRSLPCLYAPAKKSPLVEIMTLYSGPEMFENKRALQPYHWKQLTVGRTVKLHIQGNPRE